MKNQTKAYIYTAAAVLMWSTVASAFKIALSEINYIQLLLISSTTSLISLGLILILQKEIHKIYSIKRKVIVKAVGLGALNPFLYYIVLFKAYSLLPAQEAQALNYSWPLMLVILSIPILGQKVKLKSIIAIFISFIGVVIISTHGRLLDIKFSNPYGVFLAMGSSIIWALYWIFNLKNKKDELIQLFLNFLFGSIYVFFLAFFTDNLNQYSSSSILASVYIGIFEMGICFVVWSKALKYSRTTAMVSKYIYLIPFISLIFIYLIVGEKILLSTIIGLILIIIGIIIDSKKSKSDIS